MLAVTVMVDASVAVAAVPPNPARSMFPFVSFFWALLASTTAKKSPSPSLVEVASSERSTFAVTSPVVPDTSINVPATTLVTFASV